ncbi:MAG: hypothetical protein K2Q10_11220, partial [Rhodospirillales bacterium]|nr:hypothetical protein [Rhodospirillales bacterium]
VDGQVMFSYRRLPPALLGDGRSSVAELLEAANGDAIGDGVQPVTAESPFLQRQLAERGLSLGSVLADGETLRHSAPSNVAAGGAIAEYQETCRSKVAAWAARLAEACALRVCAIDLFAAHGLEDPAGFTVIEVNGNPSLMGLCATGRRAVALRIYETVAVKALG